MIQPSTQNKWLSIVEQQKQSPLTIEQFCAQLKISPSTFYQRKRELSTSAQQDTVFIKARHTQTVELEAQVPPI
ncbi:IS66 family insertion sequence element accessory protein TnpA [Psychrobium sp. nBUS_13]|uniref:IS66 family insertion sequence element accessory protein TnpA n=1 Tax=Psychrobium sp. nBUS_13 TaxID=3395319 RepID=UPI003EBBC300